MNGSCLRSITSGTIASAIAAAADEAYSTRIPGVPFTVDDQKRAYEHFLNEVADLLKDGDLTRALQGIDQDFKLGNANADNDILLIGFNNIQQCIYARNLRHIQIAFDIINKQNLIRLSIQFINR